MILSLLVLDPSLQRAVLRFLAPLKSTSRRSSR